MLNEVAYGRSTAWRCGVIFTIQHVEYACGVSLFAPVDSHCTVRDWCVCHNMGDHAVFGVAAFLTLDSGFYTDIAGIFIFVLCILFSPQKRSALSLWWKTLKNKRKELPGK